MPKLLCFPLLSGQAQLLKLVRANPLVFSTSLWPRPTAQVGPRQYSRVFTSLWPRPSAKVGLRRHSSVVHFSLVPPHLSKSVCAIPLVFFLSLWLRPTAQVGPRQYFSVFHFYLATPHLLKSVRANPLVFFILSGHVQLPKSLRVNTLVFFTSLWLRPVCPCRSTPKL